jgi:hypothetical protein
VSATDAAAHQQAPRPTSPSCSQTSHDQRHSNSRDIQAGERREARDRGGQRGGAVRVHVDSPEKEEERVRGPRTPFCPFTRRTRKPFCPPYKDTDCLLSPAVCTWTAVLPDPPARSCSRWTSGVRKKNSRSRWLQAIAKENGKEKRTQ